MGENDAPKEAAYCQRCGHALVEREIEGRPRPCCPECGHVAFLDPKLAAIVLALLDGRLVLVRRGMEPAIGRWSFPAGFVDRGEAVEDAAQRELKEETGLEARLDFFVGLYSESGSPVVLAVYAAAIVGGEMAPGHDVTEVATFDPDDLPPLPFPHDYRILEDWRAQLCERRAGPPLA